MHALLEKHWKRLCRVTDLLLLANSRRPAAEPRASEDFLCLEGMSGILIYGHFGKLWSPCPLLKYPSNLYLVVACIIREHVNGSQYNSYAVSKYMFYEQ